jgi:Sulfotransferase family
MFATLVITSCVDSTEKMIISHKYRFIFLKTAKTASTSVEIALSKHCGKKDSITPMLPADEQIRRGLQYRGPQNYLAPLTDYTVKEIISLALGRSEKKQRFFHHISAEVVKKYVGDKTWNGYYKFCVERNPWERLISLYYWICQSEPRPTISEFLESEPALSLKKFGFDLYTINEQIAVNKVCLYENLEEELEQVRLLLNIPEKLQLPQAKTEHRKDKSSYRNILDEKEIKKIEQMFSTEIRLFGYDN